MDYGNNIIMCCPDTDELIDNLPAQRKDIISKDYEYLKSIDYNIDSIVSYITYRYYTIGSKNIVDFTDFTNLINWLSFDYAKKVEDLKTYVRKEHFEKLMKLYSQFWMLFDSLVPAIFNEKDQAYYYKETD